MSYGQGAYGQGGYGTQIMTKVATAAAVLEEGGRIVVTVTGLGNAPIEGATVDISGEISDSTTTNTDGEAIFDGVPAADYTATVSKDGYWKPGEPDTKEVVVNIPAEDFTSE